MARITKTPTNHCFPGQYADAENLLSYNNNRDYDATLGRYVESDPIGFRGGLNLFSYAGQNPAQRTDPWGLMLNCPAGVCPRISPDIGGGGPVDANEGNTSGAPLIANKNEFACEVLAGLPCKLAFGEEPPAMVRCDLYASGACVFAFGLEDGEEAPYGKMCAPPAGSGNTYDPLSSLPPAPGSYSPIPSPTPINPVNGSSSPIPTTQ